MAAGTIPLSMTQQFDIYGEPLAGGKLYIITAGTVSTPQDAFVDVSLTIKQPYPMTLDAAGRVPQFFLDNTVNSTVKIRLQDKNGVVQLASDGVLVIGPATGGGGGGGLSGDATQLIQTGNLIARYSKGTDILPGYVRANGLTIGSTSSGATMPEGARPECQALFQHLWNADPNLVVTPGPRTTAAGDWGANKTIATPDWRGRVLVGLDDMGNVPSGVITASGFGNTTTLGAQAGTQDKTLIVNNLPPYTPGGVIANGALHPTFTGTPNLATLNIGAVGSSAFFGGNNALAGVNGTVTVTQDASTFTGNAQGGASTPFQVIQPSRLCTFYLKL
jgi:hypothetical protein